jgi:hypothetical protein
LAAGQGWNAPGDLAARLTGVEMGGMSVHQLIPADGQMPTDRRFHGTRRLTRRQLPVDEWQCLVSRPLPRARLLGDSQLPIFLLGDGRLHSRGFHNGSLRDRPLVLG